VFALRHPEEAAILIAFFLLVAFPVHELCHAFAAWRLGDGTARMAGRLTLNPIAHFHPIGGTFLILSVVLTGVPLGFAATPVNRASLRGRHGEAIVALAGPLSNFVLALLFGIPMRLLLGDSGLLATTPRLFDLLGILAWGNIVLGIFNLLPVPPLDGGTVMLSLLPPRTRWRVEPQLAQYGILFLVGVFLLGGYVISPVAEAVYRAVVGL
jgi:Zn-dependent protease